MSYWEQVEKFNEMYNLPRPQDPQVASNEQLLCFKSILSEELEEVDEILDIEDGLDRMTAVADWLGDIIVYCSTEARRQGLPMEKILDIIMQSNFSKLGSDGKPLYDHRGKVLKGPNYWGPEGQIKLHLESLFGAASAIS